MEKKKSGNVKIIVILVIIVCLVGVAVALYFWYQNHTKSLEEAIVVPAEDYFDKYMSVNTGASAYKVSLKMLKEANANGETYELEALDKCDEDKTVATVNIDYATGEVTETTVKLECPIF